MEKITKEELLEKLGGQPVNDEELEQVSGGVCDQCYAPGLDSASRRQCREKFKC